MSRANGGNRDIGWQGGHTQGERWPGRVDCQQISYMSVAKVGFLTFPRFYGDFLLDERVLI